MHSRALWACSVAIVGAACVTTHDTPVAPASSADMAPANTSDTVGPAAARSAPTGPAASASAAMAADATAPRACAQAAVGLDLRALGSGATAERISLYTRGEADRLRKMAPADATPRIYVTPGVASFRAELFGSSESAALATCRDVIARFLPGVAGHPLDRGDRGGGSVETPCQPCKGGAGAPIAAMPNDGRLQQGQRYRALVRCTSGGICEATCQQHQRRIVVFIKPTVTLAPERDFLAKFLVDGESSFHASVPDGSRDLIALYLTTTLASEPSDGAAPSCDEPRVKPSQR